MEFLDEVDVIALWPREQQDLVESPKWSERKEALEALIKIIEANPRCSTVTLTIYGELLDNLRKIVLRDSNFNVVLAALRVLELLAKGLRHHFSKFISMIFVPVLEKSKDKKQQIRAQLLETLDAIAQTSAVEKLVEGITSTLKKASPPSKQLINRFIGRVADRQQALPTAFTSEIVPVEVKLCSDADPEVRETACVALGAIKRICGPSLLVLFGSLKEDTAKMAKIDEYSAVSAKTHEEYAKLIPQTAALSVADDSNESTSAVGDASSSATQTAAFDPWTAMKPVSAFSLLPNNWTSALESAQWKERKEAVEEFIKILSTIPRILPEPELQNPVIAKLIAVLSTDSNINVAVECAQALKLIAEGLRTDFQQYAKKTMLACFLKFKEKRAVLRDRLVELVDVVVFTASSVEFLEAIHEHIVSTNPIARNQVIEFLARFFNAHSSSTINADFVKSITPALLKATGDADVNVRSTTLKALAEIQRLVGSDVMKVLTAASLDDSRAKKVDELCTAAISLKQSEIASESALRMLKFEKSHEASQCKNTNQPVSKVMTDTSLNSAREPVRPASGNVKVAHPQGRTSASGATNHARPSRPFTAPRGREIPRSNMMPDAALITAREPSPVRPASGNIKVVHPQGRTSASGATNHARPSRPFTAVQFPRSNIPPAPQQDSKPTSSVVPNFVNSAAPSTRQNFVYVPKVLNRLGSRIPTPK